MAPADALRELADRVATQLVAEALKRLAGGAGVVTVTVEPITAPALPAPTGQPRALKKPKPLTAAPPTKAAASAAVIDDVAARRCRKCKKLGTAERVAGTERTVRCTACRHRWDIRFARVAGAEPSAPKARPSARPAAGVCVRCEHDQEAHIGEKGKCLVPRCVCSEFYE